MTGENIGGKITVDSLLINGGVENLVNEIRIPGFIEARIPKTLGWGG